MSREAIVMIAPDWPIPAEICSALVGLYVPLIPIAEGSFFDHQQTDQNGFLVWTSEVVAVLQNTRPELAHWLRVETSWHMPGIWCLLRAKHCRAIE